MNETITQEEVAPPPVAVKTTREQILDRLKRDIETLQSKIEAVNRIPGLDGIYLSAHLFSSSIIDFDDLPHTDIVKVIKAIGGKWDKTVNGGTATRIDYQTEIEGQTIRCWAGEPPPNCRIEEVEEVVPARPETIVKKKKLICHET